MATQQPTQHATVSVDSAAAAIPSPLGIGASAVTPRKHTTNDIGGELGGFPSPPPTPAGARGEAHCVVDNVSTARNAVEAKRRSRRRARAQRRRLRRRHLRERLAIQTNGLEGREPGANADRPSSDAEATLLGGNFHPSRHRGGQFKHARDTIWLVHSCGMKVYYGWVVLAVATVAKIMSAPGQSPCIGAILVDIRNDLDLSRTTISTLYLVATATSSALLPVMGKALDWAGPRAMVSIVGLALAMTCMFMSMADSAVALCVCFFFLRFFGQGSMVMIGQTEINYWWVRRRGLVMGLGGGTMSVVMVGGITNMMHYLTHVYGWRVTYLILGAMCVVTAILGATFFRDKPEVYGLLPDGDTRRIQFRRTRTTDGSSGSWKRGRRRHHHSAGRHAHDLGAAHVMDSMSTIFSVPSAASANNVDVPGKSVVVEMATTSGGHTGIGRTAELAAEAPALDSPTLKEQVEANPALSTSVRGHIVRKGLPFGSALSQMMQVDFHETGASASSLDGDASPVEGTLGAVGSPSKQLMRQASIPEHQWVEYEGDSGNSSSSSSSSRKHNTRPVAAPMAPTPAPACGDTNGVGGVVNPGGRGALEGGVEDVGTGSPHAPSPHDSPHPPRRRSVEELLVGPAAILCTSRERRAAQRKLEQRRSMAQAGADGDAAQAGAGVGRIHDDADTQEVRGAASTQPAALLASSPRKHRKKKHRRHKKKHRTSKRRRGRGKDGGDREEEPSWTASEALRTAAFWTYSAAAFSIALTLTALYLHLEDVMADAGIDGSLAATFYVLAAVSSACANVIGGILVDRVDSQFIMCAACIFAAAGMAAVPLMAVAKHTVVWRSLAAVAVAAAAGLASGLMGNVSGVVYANMFGRRHLGTIVGVSKTCIVLGSALGPLPLGVVKDVTGTFDAGFLAFFFFEAALAVACLAFGAPPQRRSQQWQALHEDAAFGFSDREHYAQGGSTHVQTHTGRVPTPLAGTTQTLESPSPHAGAGLQSPPRQQQQQNPQQPRQGGESDASLSSVPDFRALQEKMVRANLLARRN